MKRKVVLVVLVLVAISSFVFGNTNITKNAETAPPDPFGLVYYK